MNGGLYTFKAVKEEDKGYYITFTYVPDWEDVYFFDFATGQFINEKTYYTLEKVDNRYNILLNGEVKGFLLDTSSDEALRWAVNKIVDLQGLIDQAKTIDLTGADPEAVAAFNAALEAAENADPFYDDFGDLELALKAAMEPLSDPLQPFYAYIATYDENGKLSRIVKINEEIYQFLFKPSNQGYTITLPAYPDYYLDLSSFSLAQEPVYHQIEGEEISIGGKAIGVYLDPLDERVSNYVANNADAETLATALASAKAYDTTDRSEALVNDLNDAIAAAEAADLFTDSYAKLAKDLNDVLEALENEAAGIANLDVRPAAVAYGLDGRRANRGIVILNGQKVIK